MSTLWLLYAVLVAGLLGLAASGVEAALRRTGRQGRWPWAVALLGSWVLPMRALLRGGTEGGAGGGLPLDALVMDAGAAVGQDAPGGWDLLLESLTGALGASPGWLHDPVVWVPAAWFVASAVSGAVLCAALVRLGRRSRSWQLRRVLGETVRISPDFGPALLGVVAPRIVLPRWALDLGEGALRMILSHEREHRRAGDTLLLSGAALAVLGAPWNPALWWQFRRLRLAVELDCDRRVLRAGTPRRDYGHLLVDIGARTGRIGLPAVALSENRSFLERRLETMTTRDDGYRRGRMLGALLMSGGLVVVACETPAPTSPADAPPAPPTPVEGVAPEGIVPDMDTRESGRITLREVPAGSLQDRQPLLIVDGVVVARGDVTVDPESVDRIEVVKGEAARALYGERAANGLVLVTTREGTPPPPTGDRGRALLEQDRLGLREQDRPEAGDRLREGTFHGLPTGPDPLVVVDGVISDRKLAELQIGPEDIERIEVVKGAAARALYGERGADGVIQIFTKEPPR